MAKKKKQQEKQYGYEPYEGYSKDWQPKTMTYAEHQDYLAGNPYKERAAQNLIKSGNIFDNISASTRYKGYMNQLRQQAQKNAKQSQKLKQEYTYSPDGVDRSWQLYAAKQIADTPGAYELEQERQRKAQEEENRKWREFAKEARDAGHPEIAYATKQIYDTPMPGKDKTQELYKFLDTLSGRNRAPKGYDYNSYKDYAAQHADNGRISVKSQNTMGNELMNGRTQGWYDNGNDPWLVSDEGLEYWKGYYGSEADKRYKEAEDYMARMQRNQPGDVFGDVFDFIEGIKQTELYNAATYKAESQQHKLDSEKQLNDRKETASSRKQEVRERADDFFTREGFDAEFYPMDTEENRELSRAAVYERCMNEPYEEAIKRLTPYQKKELDARIDAAILQAQNVNPDYMPDVYNAKYADMLREADAYNAKQKEYESVQGTWKSVSNIAGWTNQYSETKEYDPSLVKGLETKTLVRASGVEQEYYEPKGSETDKAYYWMNNIPDENDVRNDFDKAKKYYFVTDEMRDTFNILYKHDRANGSNTADLYLQALDPYLNTCLSHYIENANRQIADDPIAGTLARIVSYPMQAVGGVMGTVGSVLGLLGVESAQDPNSGWYLPSKSVQIERDQGNQNFAEWAANIHPWFKDNAYRAASIIDSLADNIFALGTAGALTGNLSTNAAKTLIQLIMSGEATSNTMIRKLESGTNPTEAALYAIGDGVIEWITEEWSLEQILKPNLKAMLSDKKALSSFLFKSFLAEGSEEIAADVANMALDSVMSMINGHRTEIAERVDELIASGMDKKDATKQALDEKLEEIGYSGLAGALSGLAMGGGRLISSAISQVQSGNRISGNNYNGIKATDTLLDMAKNMAADSMSAQQAAAIQQKIDAGQKVTNKEIGKLAQTIQMETSEAADKAAKIGNADKFKSNIRNLDVVDDILSGKEGPAANVDSSTDNLTRLGILATQEDMDSAEGTKGRGSGSVIVDGKYRQLVGIGKDGKAKLMTSRGMPESVDIAQVKATDYNTATILQQHRENPGLFTSEYTTKILQSLWQNGQMDNSIAMPAAAIRYAAFTGSAMPNIANMDQTLAKELYDFSVKEFAERRKNDLQNQNAKKPGEGTARFKGTQYGTQEFETALKKSGMSRIMQNRVRTWSELAKQAGIDLVFEDNADVAERLKGTKSEGTDPSTIYGSEDFGGIMLNIEGEQFRNGQATGEKHNIGVSFSHEFVHWLQRNSMQGYDNLMNYVLNEQRKARGGQSGLVERLENIMRHRDVDLYTAVSELVADSCDQILGNEQVIRHIEETNKSLYKDLRNFVKDRVARVRNAWGNMAEHASMDSRRMVHANMKHLADLFNVAYDEAHDVELRQNYMDEDADVADSAKQSRADTDTTEWKTYSRQNGQWTMRDGNGNVTTLTGEDAEYVAAWKRGDYGRMEEMLAEKIRQNGAIPFKTPRSYSDPNHRWVANAIKEGNMTAVRTAAQEMATMVPDNAVLVPMPNHYGQVTDDTDTMILAKEISKITGRPVVAALEGTERESRQADKQKPKSQQMKAEDLGFRQVAELPEGTVPYIVDNVIASGLTAQAAHEALGNNGVTLAYAKTTRSANDGLKRANVTFYDTNQQYGQYLIPLSERIDMSKTGYPGVKFSQAEIHERYKGESLYKDSSIYDYDFLTSLPNIQVNVEDDITKIEDKNGMLDRAKLVKEGFKNAYEKAGAEEVNGNAVVINDYTGRKLGLTARSFTHSTHTTSIAKDRANARVAMIAAKLAKNAVPINGLTNVKNVAGTYAMAAPVVSADGKLLKSAIITVEIRSGNVVGVDVTDHVHAVSARKMNGVGVNGVFTPAGRSTVNGSTVTTRSDMTIANLLDLVNSTSPSILSDDVLEHYNRTRPQNGYWTGRTLFSMAEMDSEYDAAVKSGDTARMQALMDEAARRAGYTVKAYHGTPEGGFTVFETGNVRNGRVYGNGIYFTDSQSEAEMYSRKPGNNPKVYESYINLGNNPLVIDVAEIRKREGGNSAYVYNEIREIYKSDYNDATAVVLKNMNASGNTMYIVKDSSQVKSADPVTYDNNGNVIKPSKRFDSGNKDIRWSKAEPIVNDQGEEVAVALPGDTIAETRYSVASYYDDDERGKMTKALMKRGYTKEQIDRWMKSLDNVAKVILSDRLRYDFVADRSKKFLKDNGDVYKKTLDASTMCKKTRLYNGTFNLIQHMMPNTILMPEDLIDLYNLMKTKDLETPCGLCYVQSRRRQLGPYTEEWLKEYKGKYIPTVDEVTTSDGLEKLKEEHPQAYIDFVKAMNKKGVNNPKLVQQRTDYRGDIRRLTKDTVAYLKKIGGLRIQSFSDFEVVHMLDMMQAVMDMKAVGLTAQAYTKVPAFAWIFGPTGIKINVSLLGKGVGVDHHGNLVMDDDEGMPYEEAMALREAYPKNVGTIIVGINDEHIIAAMGDSNIDFIIPFHKSGWSQKELEKMKTLKSYKDYTETQNEYNIVGVDENGQLILEKAESNIDPLSYWDYKVNGEANTRKYLQLCAEQKIVPKFRQFLTDNGDGTWSLPEGTDERSTNIREGYWKTLIDFKMYDNNGIGAPQVEVEPNFNMDKAMEILGEYDGSHRELPQSREAAEEFVEQYKKTHPLDSVRTKYSQAERYSDAEDSMDVAAWLAQQSPSSFRTEDERVLWDHWKGVRTNMELALHAQQTYRDQIRKLEAKGDQMTAEERKQLQIAKNLLKNWQAKQDRYEKEMQEITSDSGYATMMRNANMVVSDFVAGRTQDQVTAAVDQMAKDVADADKELARQERELEKLADSSAVKTVRRILGARGLTRTANTLRTQYNSSMSREEIENRLAEIVIKNAQGEDATADIEALANDIVSNQVGYGNEEAEQALSNLRGMTIVIGPGQQAEMKGNHITLKDIRQRTRGSGIKFEFGTKSTLDRNATEIYEAAPELRDKFNDEKAALDNFVGYVESMLALKKGNAADSGIDQGEVEAFIRASANIVLNEQTGGLRGEALLAKIKEEQGRIGTALDAVRGAREGMRTAAASGQKAQVWAGVLRQDMDVALNYYNKMAKLAAQTERNAMRKTLIEQLRGENTRKLIEQQAHYQEMMKKDRRARELQVEIGATRNRIDTNIKRISRLMTNETDLKNIPEEAKPLARLVVKMLADHDSNYRRVTFSSKQDLVKLQQTLKAWSNTYGDFTDGDLDWLVIGEGTDADYDVHDKVIQDLIDIESGLLAYRTADGRGVVTLQDRYEALQKVQNALGEIWNVIKARQSAEIRGRKAIVQDLALAARDDMQKSRFKGEWTGWLGKKIGKIRSAVVYGNMTPEYFFKNLRNETLSGLYDEYHRAENRNGLEVLKAKQALAKIAEETGYSTWDPKKRYTLKLEKGGEVQLTLGEMMSLYATWQREEMNQAELNGPDKSFHLEQGGFYIEQEAKKKVAGREIAQQRAHRVTANDIANIRDMMTPEQLEYVERVVKYITEDIGELGNEASMRMYGIRKFTEKYYFPFEVWHGVLASKSNTGAQQSTQNRIAHGSQTKRRKANAKNALVIRDFTETVVKHIAAQINYNTFAPAIEYMQRVMNSQVEEGTGPDDATSRNLWALFREVYGADAERYFKDFQNSINGGPTRVEGSIYDKLISTFRKSAVSGSMSVALQQPLSYIRAAIEINPKYLTLAMNPKYYKGSIKEMQEHSGVAVLKRMGKFDMGIGASAQQYMMPEAKQTKPQAAYRKISDATTVLPEMMDAVTWSRLWTAVKLEQAELNPGMDQKSKEFMDKVTERFNYVLRMTQVYDSTLVRSKNMRSKNPFTKMMTSFMAEPTLTANTLADSLINAKEKGGKTRVAKAGAAFIMSAVAQAIVKGLMGAGRNPDKKKTWDENVAYRFMSNFLNEINPFTLIPGYSDAITLMKEGELSDDALGMIGKIFEAGKKGLDIITKGSEDPWRDVEDSVGVIAQIFTDIPYKNLMRDARAMYNFFTQPYSQRETSGPVLKYQALDQVFTADNLLGVLNKWTNNTIWGTSVKDYEQRVYMAKLAGDEKAAQELEEYYIMAKSNASDPAKNLRDALNKYAKEDDDLSYKDRINTLKQNGKKEEDISKWIVQEFKDGKLEKAEAEELWLEANPKKTKQDAHFKFEKLEYEMETGEDITDTEWFRVNDAVDNGDVKAYKEAVEELKQYGYQEKDITNHAVNRVTKMYKEGDLTRKETEMALKKYDSSMTDNDIWWKLDQIEYNKETGGNANGNDRYYRLKDAVNANKSDQIRSVVNDMLKHGMTKEKIKGYMSNWKSEYLSADLSGKNKIRDAIEKAYKALGYTAGDADKMIEKWSKKKK